MMSDLDPVCPGEILLEEFLAPLKISQEQLARGIDVPKSRISQIVRAKRAVTADTALRLSAYFKTSPEFWMNLQSEYELRRARREAWPEIAPRIRPYRAA